MDHVNERLILVAQLKAINIKLDLLRAETEKRTEALRELKRVRINNRTMFKREKLETIIKGK